jgi:ABC-type dipeptide/oligopeptide/nickel transport system ATPase component
MSQNGHNRTLISIDNLKTYFKTMDGIVRAVDGVSLDIKAGEALGLVGESGCGKSVFFDLAAAAQNQSNCRGQHQLLPG